MADQKKSITIRLTPDEARLVRQNADGWLDAGACKGGLEADEKAALHSLCDQISAAERRKPRAAQAATIPTEGS